MAQKPVSQRYMARTIRGATLEELARITRRERFRTAAAFELLAERCKQICDETPRLGLPVARLLVDFSSHFSSDAQGRAACLLGAACRRNRRYGAAWEAYQKALTLPLSDSVKGTVLHSQAVLHLDLLDFPRALEDANAAIELQEGERLGVALVIRSKIYASMGDFKSSSEDAEIALALLDAKKDQRSFISAVQSIAVALLARPESSNGLRDAFTLIAAVKRHLRGNGSGRYRSAAWLYLDWVEGQINGRLGSHRQAIRQLEKVRSRLCEIGGDCYLRDALLISVDLAVVYDMMAESGRAVEECNAAFQIARSLGLESEATMLAAYQRRRSLVGLDREIRGIEI